MKTHIVVICSTQMKRFRSSEILLKEQKSLLNLKGKTSSIHSIYSTPTKEQTTRGDGPERELLRASHVSLLN